MMIIGIKDIIGFKRVICGGVILWEKNSGVIAPTINNVISEYRLRVESDYGIIECEDGLSQLLGWGNSPGEAIMNKYILRVESDYGIIENELILKELIK